MELAVIKWVYEKPNFVADKSRSKQGNPFSVRPNRSWRLDRDKDCCFIVVNRGAEAGMDRHGSGVKPDEPKPMDSRHKSEWPIGSSAPDPTWPTDSTNFQYAEGTGFSLREEPR